MVHVDTMQTAQTLLVLTFVIVKLDMREMEQIAQVPQHYLFLHH